MIKKIALIIFTCTAVSACGSSSKSEPGDGGTTGATTSGTSTSGTTTSGTTTSGTTTSGTTTNGTTTSGTTTSGTTTSGTTTSGTTTGSTTSGSTTSGSTTSGGTDLTPPSGLLDTGRPEFVWPAVAGAEAYKIVVQDAGGNGYQKLLDPVAAGCQTGEGNCSSATSMGYFDNDLTWFVESTVNGAAGPSSSPIAITTPVSANMQPIKSNTGICEAWPSVAYDKYVVLNNSWNSKVMTDNSWTQVINVTENADGSVSSSWTYDWLGESDAGQFGEFEVKAYPEVLYGPKLGTHVSGTKEETGLPELVRNLPEFVVTYDFTETDTNAERNVALESFFHDSCSIQGPCDDVDNRSYEMMIWVNNPTIRTPGDLALTGVMVDNKLWNVYIKPRSNKHYIAFTAQTPSTSGTINWKRFVDWTEEWTAANAEELQIDKLDPDFCMGAIEIGTEMWWGQGKFTLNKFEVTR